MSKALSATQVPPQMASLEIERRMRSEPNTSVRSDIGDLLVRLGYLSEAKLKKIRALQKKSGGRFEKIALRMRAVRKDQLTTALALNYGYLRAGSDVKLPPKALSVIHAPSSTAAEEIRKLRTFLLTERTPEELGLFSLAPASSAVRVDYLAVNLATAFATLKRRVLLVDADLKRSRIRKFFNLPKQEGLFDVLDGGIDLHDALIESPVMNLSLLAAGAPRHNAQELIAGKTLEATLQDAKSLFDVVIVVTAPVDRDAEARFVWTATERSLAVARRDVTRHHELQNLRSTFRQLNVDVIGAVMMR